MKGMRQRAQQGHLVFRPPYGYSREIIERQEGHKRTRIISRPIVNEKTAPIVRRIFDDFERGMGYKAIAMTLNDEGYRTEEGNRFRFQHIARILRNKAYIGVLEFHIRQDRAVKEPLVIPSFYPPIIEDDQFNRVQEKLKALLPYWQNAHAHKTEYLLSTLVVCDRCNHRYVGTAAKGGRFHYYSCQSYLKRGKRACDSPLLNKDKLETAVLNRVQEQILTADNVRSYIDLVLEQARSDQKPSAEETAIITALAAVDAKLGRWEEALERGTLIA